MRFERIAEGLNVGPIIDAVRPEMWSEATFRQNYPGSAHRDTETIFLRWSHGLSQEDILYTDSAVDWPAAETLGESVGPIYSEISKTVGAELFGRAMLVKLKAGGVIDRHADEGTYSEHFDRFHLCVTGKSAVTVEDETFRPQPGELWWINHKLPHSVIGGPEDRINLVADFVSPYRLKRETYFQRERLFESWPEMMPLITQHYEEVAPWPDIPLAPDFNTYTGMEPAIRYFTVRDGGKLVGYAVFIVKQHLHYVGCKVAQQDIVFLEKAHRKTGTGKRFLAWCDDRLAAEGVEVVTHHVKAKPELDFSPMLETMGYELLDKIMARRLRRA